MATKGGGISCREDEGEMRRGGRWFAGCLLANSLVNARGYGELSSFSLFFPFSFGSFGANFSGRERLRFVLGTIQLPLSAWCFFFFPISLLVTPLLPFSSCALSLYLSLSVPPSLPPSVARFFFSLSLYCHVLESCLAFARPLSSIVGGRAV